MLSNWVCLRPITDTPLTGCRRKSVRRSESSIYAARWRRDTCRKKDTSVSRTDTFVRKTEQKAPRARTLSTADYAEQPEYFPRFILPLFSLGRSTVLSLITL
ncbi:hypothetical protein PUN28_005015 [Cardiocondyla obscurior]|uniref:Uncharacterized protein n=1 Tax=Cardiocondyla obscurior TaxID=286306 RepID=A0AAW2GGG5_9HYME